MVRASLTPLENMGTLDLLVPQSSSTERPFFIFLAHGA